MLTSSDKINALMRVTNKFRLKERKTVNHVRVWTRTTQVRSHGTSVSVNIIPSWSTCLFVLIRVSSHFLHNSSTEYHYSPVTVNFHEPAAIRSSRIRRFSAMQSRDLSSLVTGTFVARNMNLSTYSYDFVEWVKRMWVHTLTNKVIFAKSYSCHFISLRTSLFVTLCFVNVITENSQTIKKFPRFVQLKRNSSGKQTSIDFDIMHKNTNQIDIAHWVSGARRISSKRVGTGSNKKIKGKSPERWIDRTDYLSASTLYRQTS